MRFTEPPISPDPFTPEVPASAPTLQSRFSSDHLGPDVSRGLPVGSVGWLASNEARGRQGRDSWRTVPRLATTRCRVVLLPKAIDQAVFPMPRSPVTMMGFVPSPSLMLV